MLVKQGNRNKLSITFEDTPYRVINKYGKEVTGTSPERVSYKRNVTDVKHHREQSKGLDQLAAEDAVKGGIADAEVSELPVRPIMERHQHTYMTTKSIKDKVRKGILP